MRETQAADLDECGDGDGEDGERLADGDALQDGEAARLVGEAPGDGDEKLVADGQEEAGGKVQDQWHGGGGNLKIWADVAVQGGALREEEGSDLGIR